MALTQGVIRRAISESRKSTYYPAIGAVIFKGSRILGAGYNDIRSSSINLRYKKCYFSLHAEQAAIMNVKNWDVLKGCSILVVRVPKKSERFGICKPCLMCQSMIRHVGIKNIYYTNYDGEIVKM